MPPLNNVGNETHEEYVVRRIRLAAECLTDVARELTDEAAWIEDNYPERGWSEETALSYLRSSTLSRLAEVRRAGKRASDVLTATDECLAIEATKTTDAL